MRIDSQGRRNVQPRRRVLGAARLLPGAKARVTKEMTRTPASPYKVSAYCRLIVGQGHHELTGLGQSARRYRAFLLD